MISIRRSLLLGFAAAALLGGCTTPQMIAGAAAVTVVGGASPGNELEQTYYLGVFDPEEQVPPSLYRIRVRGQASAFSQMRFASGWVPAAFVDSLDSQLGFDPKSGNLTMGKPSMAQALADEAVLGVEKKAAEEAKASRAKSVERAEKALDATLAADGFTAGVRGKNLELLTARVRAVFVRDAWKSRSPSGADAAVFSTRDVELAAVIAAGTEIDEELGAALSALRAQEPTMTSAASLELVEATKAATDSMGDSDGKLEPVGSDRSAQAVANDLRSVAPSLAYVLAVRDRVAALKERGEFAPKDALDKALTEANALLDDATPPSRRQRYNAALESIGSTSVTEKPQKDGGPPPLDALLGQRIAATRGALTALRDSSAAARQQQKDLEALRAEVATKDSAADKRVAEFAAKAAASKAISGSLEEKNPTFKVGRRLVLFGPEGFREAPANHRLAIVMGSSPQAFFDALGGTLKTVQKIELARAHQDVAAAAESFRAVLGEERRLAEESKETAEQLAADAEKLKAPPAAAPATASPPAAGGASTPGSGTTATTETTKATSTVTTTSADGKPSEVKTVTEAEKTTETKPVTEEKKP